MNPEKTPDRDLAQRATTFAAEGRAQYEQKPFVLLEPDQYGNCEALVRALLPAAERLARRHMLESQDTDQRAA